MGEEKMKIVNGLEKALFVASVVVVSLIGASPAAGAADFSSWAWTAPITFSGYSQSGTLTNFPALVVLGTNISGFSYSQFESADGGDLRFADSAGTNELNYEVDEWDTNGVSYVWVQVPAISGTNTRINAYWGKSGESAPDYTTNGAAWSNGYLGVWHLKEAGNAPADSALIPSDNSGVDAGTDATLSNAVVGKGYDYAGAGRVDLSNAGDFSGLNEVTVSFWYFKRSGGGGGYGTILGSSSTSYGIRHVTNSLAIKVRLGGTWYDPVGSLATSEWTHIGIVFDNAADSLDGFKNGSAANSLSTTKDWISSIRLIGIANYDTRAPDGIVDEIRVANTIRSADWLWAECLNMASNGVFNVYGEAVEQGGGPGAARGSFYVF